MKEMLEGLLRVLGTHTAVAKALGYTDRQYLNIRRKVERGEELNPRVKILIHVRTQMLQDGEAANFSGNFPVVRAMGAIDAQR